MDVRCENCNSEYDFDEARIPEEGLPVKCSHCNHVFKVHRPGKGGGERGAEWMVRQTSGAVFSFRELTTLQRWIVERKVSRDDEISKTGKNWKRLGDIAELATFFQVVEAQVQATPAPQPLPVAGFPAPFAAQPAAYGVMQQGAMQQPVAMPVVQPAVVAVPGMVQPGAYPGPGGWDPSAPWGKQGAWQAGGRSGEAPAYDEEPRRGKRWVVVAVVLLLLLCGGAAGTYLFVPQLYRSLLGRPNELAVSNVKSAYAELDRDNYAGINAALEQLEKAVAIDGRYDEARAGVAEAALARAEYLREEADAASAHLTELPEAERAAAAGAIEQKRSEASQLSERAFSAAKEALALAPDGVAGNRAMAEYYRFKKAPDQMRPLLDKARAAGPLDARVSYVLGAAVAPEPTSAERAIRYFDEALERAPQLQRARYKLARVYQAQGDKDRALLHLETLRKAVPDHERAAALLLELKPPQPVVAEPQPPVEEKPLTFEQVVAKAERLRESDQARKALTLYQRAGEMQPDDPDVKAGIGWCYVDIELPDAAITQFNAALRIAPRLSDAHMGIAEAYRLKNNKAEALKHYQAYLDIMPNGSEAGVARRMIKMLEN